MMPALIINNMHIQISCICSLVKQTPGQPALSDAGRAEPHSSVCSFLDFRTGSGWFDPQLGQYSFRGLMSHCDRIYSSLTAVRCFDNDFGKEASGLERIFC